MQMIYHTFTTFRPNFFKNYFFPSGFIDCNKLDTRLRKTKSFTDLKKNILSFIRPKENSGFNFNSSKGLKFVTRLRLGLSHLREHRFKHSFQDSINLLCSSSSDVESTIHYTNTEMLNATVNYILATKRFDECSFKNVMFDKMLIIPYSLCYQYFLLLIFLLF